MALPASERGISPNPEVLTIKELTPNHVREVARRTRGGFSFSIDGNYDGQARVTYPEGVIAFGTHIRDGVFYANGWSANLVPNNRRNIILRETALVLGPDDSVRFVGTPDLRTRGVPVITVTGAEPFYKSVSLPPESLDSLAQQAVDLLESARRLAYRRE